MMRHRRYTSFLLLKFAILFLTATVFVREYVLRNEAVNVKIGRHDVTDDDDDDGLYSDIEVANPIQRDRDTVPKVSTICKYKVLVLIELKTENRFTKTVFDVVSPVPDIYDDVYKTTLECPTRQSDSCSVELTFAANYSRHMQDKDAVVLNMAQHSFQINADALFKHIDQPQLMIFFSIESPIRVHENLEPYKLHTLPVHGIWTYHSKSPIYRPYGSYRPDLLPPEGWDNVRQFDNKTRMVVWTSSNCDRTYWPRWGLVREIQKYVSVDVYGPCGDDKKTRSNCRRFDPRCDQLISTYKFYLSFENGECEDYITEKVWYNALSNGVVPIVYGAPRKDYERLLPPNSFIYAGDFDTYESLGNYLNKLDRRPDLYKRYFEWTGTVYHNVGVKLSSFCGLLPLIGQVEAGDLKKKPLNAFPWFNTCRMTPADATQIMDLQPDWRPW